MYNAKMVPLLGDRYLHQRMNLVTVQCQLETGDPVERVDKGRGAQCYEVHVGIKTQEPCTSVYTVAVCGADVISVQQVSSWCCDFANGQVSWMRSEVALHQHQTCISMMTKWCWQTCIVEALESWHSSSHIPLSGMMSMNAIAECAADGCHNKSDQQKVNRMATSLTSLQCYRAECTDCLSCIITHGCITDEDGIHEN